MTEAAAVLFDLDGTLTDSAAGIQRSTREALRRLNAEDGGDRPIPAESELGWIVGPPLRESFAKLAGDENADRMLELYRERYDTIGIFENKVYDGVAAALDRLRARGDRLFVATSKRRGGCATHRRTLRPRPAISTGSTARNRTGGARTRARSCAVDRRRERLEATPARRHDRRPPLRRARRARGRHSGDRRAMGLRRPRRSWPKPAPTRSSTRRAKSPPRWRRCSRGRIASDRPHPGPLPQRERWPMCRHALMPDHLLGVVRLFEPAMVRASSLSDSAATASARWCGFEAPTIGAVT